MGTPPELNNSTLSLAVCICTYQRPEGLQRLLCALRQQVYISVPAPDTVILVVDNASRAEAASIVEAFNSNNIRYFHEPHPGISHARNACLAAVPQGTDFIAMIDDDMEPANNWLDSLLDAQRRSGADVVVGATQPVFPAGTAQWIDATGFFDKPQQQENLRDLDPDPPAATCNVLLRASLFDDPANRFDPALSLSGGEDKLLFQHLKLQGARFAWAREARASEYFPAQRATLGYMWKEAYRRGNVKYLVKRRLKSRSAARSAWIALRLLLRSSGRLLRDVLLSLVRLPGGRPAWVPVVLRLADSLGTIAGVLHMPNRHYRTAN